MAFLHTQSVDDFMVLVVHNASAANVKSDVKSLLFIEDKMMDGNVSCANEEIKNELSGSHVNRGLQHRLKIN